MPKYTDYRIEEEYLLKKDPNKYEKRNIDHNLKIAEMLPPKDALILDVGCGGGFTSKLYIKEGNRVIGVDIFTDVLKEAREVLYGVILQDIEEEWGIRSKTFDVVIMSAILEHIYRTDFVIREAYRVLKDDGVLLVAVPNIAFLNNRILLLFGRRLRWISPRHDHIRVYTKYLLKEVLEDNNFKVEKIIGNELYFPKTKIRIPFINRLFPNLCSVIICKARKKMKNHNT